MGISERSDMADDNKQSNGQPASKAGAASEGSPDLPSEETLREILESPEPPETKRAQLNNAKSKLQARMSANPSAHYNKLIEGIDDALAEIESAGGDTGSRSPTDLGGTGRA